MKTRTRNFFQTVGTGASVLLGGITLFGVGQTQFVSNSGQLYEITTGPLKAIIIGSLAFVILLSFTIAYIAKKQSKRK